MWLFLAFLTAFLTSLSDVAGRKALDRGDPYLIAWAWSFFCFIFLLPFVVIRGVPPLGLAFGPAILTSGLILTVSVLFYAKAIKISDLSLTMPMLTLTPIFLLATSAFILGEHSRPIALWGILLIVVGAYILNVKEWRHGFWAPFQGLLKEGGPRYMLVVAILYSIGANVDKIGVQNSSPLFWTMALNGVIALPLSILILLRVPHTVSAIRSQIFLFFLMGILNGLANLSQMTAINLTIVPYLIAIKRTSVFITSLFGFWLFKEKGWTERSLGIICMLLGVFVIALFQ